MGGGQRSAAGAEEVARLLARDPDSLRFAEYADHLRRMERLSDALAVCRHGLARHPAYATGHVVMAEILLDSGTPEGAADHLREAVKLDPRHPRAHLLLGELLLRHGEKERAAAEFEAALLANPGLAQAQLGLAEATGALVPSPPQPAVSPPPRDRAGQRPDWLTDDSINDLVALVVVRAAIQRAHVLDASGRVLARSSAGGPPPSGDKEVALIGDLRALACRLAAGRLRSLALRSPRAVTLHLPLGDLLLVAELRPEADLDAEIASLSDAIASGPGAEVRRRTNG